MKKLLLLAALIASPLSADIATVVAIRGDVKTQHTTLSQGAQISVGDVVSAADRSFAILQFTDGSKVTIRPKSKVIIEEYSYQEGVTDKARFDILEGGLRIVTGAMAKRDPDNYVVSTPVALMGVRGTEFSIQLVDSIEEIEEYGGF